jgi:AbrB family transcriptional regulator (stage V sporulation protein T)
MKNMKATGIVRRIDDLGRVIIPKEIRRTLRLRDGDPMEIFIDNNNVVFKKYKPFDNLNDYAQKYSESLYKTSGHICFITDRDTIIGVSGISKIEYFEKPISNELEKVMEDRIPYIAKNKNDKIIPITKESASFYSQVIIPITSEGEIVGAVIFMSQDTNVTMGLVEKKLAEAAAGFLGKTLED